MRGRALEEYKEGQTKDPEFREAWNSLDAEFKLIESMIKAREKAGVTQSELAKKIGTKQPALSRLERGGFRKATVETLGKIADALDSNLVITLEPKRKGRANR